MKKATVYAKHMGARTSVKKASPVMKLVRGKNVGEAKKILEFHQTKASDLILKVLKSAIANARTNLNLSEKDLYIAEIYANGGKTMHRGRIVARSRTSPIKKRTAHLVVGLSERSKDN